MIKHKTSLIRQQNGRLKMFLILQILLLFSYYAHIFISYLFVSRHKRPTKDVNETTQETYKRP